MYLIIFIPEYFNRSNIGEKIEHPYESITLVGL